MKKIRYLLLIVIVLVAGYVVFDSLTQPNTSKLKGGFKEVASFRNENNTGPVVRVYAVTLQDTLWEEMLKYGELMPYTKYGTTTVYFFREGGAFPTRLTREEAHIDLSSRANCLAKYSKGTMSEVKFVRFPFGEEAGEPR